MSLATKIVIRLDNFAEGATKEELAEFFRVEPVQVMTAISRARRTAGKIIDLVERGDKKFYVLRKDTCEQSTL